MQISYVIDALFRFLYEIIFSQYHHNNTRDMVILLYIFYDFHPCYWRSKMNTYDRYCELKNKERPNSPWEGGRKGVEETIRICPCPLPPFKNHVCNIGRVRFINICYRTCIIQRRLTLKL